MSDSLRPYRGSPPGSSVHGILQARLLDWVALLSSGDLPDPGIKLMSPAAPGLQADPLPLSHQGSPPDPKPSTHSFYCITILLICRMSLEASSGQGWGLLVLVILQVLLAPVPADVPVKREALRVSGSACHSWCSAHMGVRAGVPHTRE